ncbi:hypothetical protein [Amycolatopsis pigmentata]|uniref:Flp pilus-assembly TadG-like N-terminal domain-containing protein n=1 Tax=Amycolatopsis pigmentata TaxID=450801 RepID=A0ABW5FIK5_9PSEU
MDHAGFAGMVRQLHKDESGGVTAFVVVFVAAVIAFSGLVLDGGLALAGKVRAMGEAQEAARAGAQAIDLSAYRSTGELRLIAGEAVTLASQYLAAAGRSGEVTVTRNIVSVKVTDTHHSLLLGAVGVKSLTTIVSASAQPEHGVTTPEP